MARNTASRRHGRRGNRSSMTGPYLTNPESRVQVFRKWSTAVAGFLQDRFPDELADVKFGFVTAPLPEPYSPDGDQDLSRYYEIDRVAKTIILHRMLIQRFKGLHENDDVHRRLFVEHVVYRAVCDYLDVQPWQLLPGYFDHY